MIVRLCVLYTHLQIEYCGTVRGLWCWHRNCIIDVDSTRKTQAAGTFAQVAPRADCCRLAQGPALIICGHFSPPPLLVSIFVHTRLRRETGRAGLRSHLVDKSPAVTPFALAPRSVFLSGCSLSRSQDLAQIQNLMEFSGDWSQNRRAAAVTHAPNRGGKRCWYILQCQSLTFFHTATLRT